MFNANAVVYHAADSRIVRHKCTEGGMERGKCERKGKCVWRKIGHGTNNVMTDNDSLKQILCAINFVSYYLL